MTKRPSPEPSRTRVSVRAAALLGAAVVLASCNTYRQATAPYPNDVRQRHPITIRDGERTVELFIGPRRGVLTPSQRADVMSFAYAWRHDATGGVVLDVPTGTVNDRAAHEAAAEVRSLLAAIGIPAHAIEAR